MAAAAAAAHPGLWDGGWPTQGGDGAYAGVGVGIVGVDCGLRCW